MLVRGEQGEIPVAGRARKRIPGRVVDDLRRIHSRLGVISQDDCNRGGGCAAIREASEKGVKRGFVVMGKKLDRFTQQGICHSGDSTDPANEAEIQALWEELQVLYKRDIAPLVMDSFALLFKPVVHWIEDHGFTTWVEHATACTFGSTFGQGFTLTAISGSQYWCASTVARALLRGEILGFRHMAMC